MESVLQPAPFTQSIPEPAPDTQSVQEPKLIDLLGLSPTPKALPPLLVPSSSSEPPVLSIFFFFTLPLPLPYIIALMVLFEATGLLLWLCHGPSWSSGSSQLAPPVQSQSPNPPWSLELWNPKRPNPQAQTLPPRASNSLALSWSAIPQSPLWITIPLALPGVWWGGYCHVQFSFCWRTSLNSCISIVNTNVWKKYDQNVQYIKNYFMLGLYNLSTDLKWS